MFRVFALVLLLLILLLQIKLWQGEGSWTQTQALRKQVEAQRAENARLKARNDALSAEVADLKSGETAVEERARSELGMVKPGETFYRVVEPAAAGSAAVPEEVPEDVAHGCASAAIGSALPSVAGCEKAAAAKPSSAPAPMQAPKK